MFFCFLSSVFCFWKSHYPCRKKKIKRIIRMLLKLNIGPIMLRNMLGAVFNFNLDQFLTLEFCYFLFCFCVFVETLIFIVFFSAKHAELKETPQRLIVLVKMSVFFFCIFDFCCFSNVFERCFYRYQKI